MTDLSTIKPAPGSEVKKRRRAFSLVEVIMASMLLAIIASAVVGGITTVISADARNQQKLEGLELANRLLLQYLDDKDAMPNPDAQVVQGRGTYRWVLRVSPVQLTMPERSVISTPAEGPGSKTIDKLVLLSVSVYAGVPDGMGGFAHGDRICTLTRVYHPLSVIYRNPDMMVRLASDPARMLEMMLALTEGGTTSRTNPDSARNGGSGNANRPATAGGGGGGGGGGGEVRGGGGASSGPKPVGSDEMFSGSRNTGNRNQ